MERREATPIVLAATKIAARDCVGSIYASLTSVGGLRKGAQVFKNGFNPDKLKSCELAIVDVMKLWVEAMEEMPGESGGFLHDSKMEFSKDFDELRESVEKS